MYQTPDERIPINVPKVCVDHLNTLIFLFFLQKRPRQSHTHRASKKVELIPTPITQDNFEINELRAEMKTLHQKTMDKLDDVLAYHKADDDDRRNANKSIRSYLKENKDTLGPEFK